MPRNNECPRVERLLKKAELAFNNALTSSEIMSRLAEYGYDEARLQGCQEKVEKLRHLYQTQIKLRAKTKAATASYQQARREAELQHRDLVQRARLLAQHYPGLTQALLLKSRGSSKAYSSWSARQNQFYTRLENDADLAAQLLDYGITAEKLMAGRQAYLAAKEAYLARTDLKGLARQATTDRNVAEVALKACLELFAVTIQYALADNPRRLDGLGVG